MSSPHERIGRYEVLRKIATGGMAELFLAKQVGMEGFEKVVAIKRILAHLAYDDEFINMFRDEARIVAKLSHPNIVQIYDLGKSDDTYFIAMEYIPGRNLSSIAKRAKLKGERIPPGYIARCVAQACEGLYYAHTRKDIDGRPLRIVHRDVSPQNIIVSFSGTVKLVDFGIAKAATKIAHTRAGVLKGKYAYMSPEQIRGEEIDARSDLFAVGIVLYELMAGRRPFEKENSIQTLKAIVQEPHKDVRELNPDVPEELSAIIDKALTKDAARRYQDAQEIQIALEDFVSSGPNRCNNITISNWVQNLFAEELSRERGGTMVFQGVGEVILPEVEERPPDEPAEAMEEAEDPASEPLQRGRGGGSVETRPPIPAPSNSLIESMAEYERSSPSRASLLEEDVIPEPRHESISSGGFDDDATVHAFGDAGPSETGDVLEEGEIDRPLKAIKFDDGKTEFSPPTHDEERDDATVPKEDDEPDQETSEHPVVEKSGLWDEATIGVKEAPTISPDRPFSLKRIPIPPAATIATPKDDDPEAWGDLSGSFESKNRDSDLWDDKTAQNNDAYLAAAMMPSPTVEEIGSGLELMPALSEHSQDIEEPEVKGDPTISASALEDPELLSDAGEDEDLSDDFEGDQTIAAPSLVFPDDSSDVFNEDRTLHPGELEVDDSGGWASDATIAAADPIEHLEEEIEVPMEPDETMRSIDDEPSLPEGVDLSRDVDKDIATLAGVTSDFVRAGLRPPGHTYEPKVEDRPAFGRPKTKQERLGAIKLSKVAAVAETGVLETGFGNHEEETEGEIDEKSPVHPTDLDSGPVSGELHFEFEDSAYTEGELPNRLNPKQENRAHKELYDAAQQEYSALVAPKGLTPLVPQPKNQGAMHIGSTNVPPANLSLSEMLHDPKARGTSSSREEPGVRSATMLGRQIREVVRNPSELPQQVVMQTVPPVQVTLEPQPIEVYDPELMNAPPTFDPLPPPRGRSKTLMAALIAIGVACLATMAYYLIPLLAPSSQHLTIRTTPVGATVYVDEAMQAGITPLTIEGLKPGVSYQIRLELSGFESISREVLLPPNRPLIWQIPLKPKPSVTSSQ